MNKKSNTYDLDYQEVSGWFWNIIREAKNDEDKLKTVLNRLTKEEIYRFQDEFITASIDLTGERFASYLESSDDGADDMCHWIVSQGKDYYLKIWKSPNLIPSSFDITPSNNLFGVACEVYEENFNEALNLQ